MIIRFGFSIWFNQYNKSHCANIFHLNRVRNAEYRELLEQNDAIDDHDQRAIQLQRQRQRIRQENTLEAQIQPGDTLQAIALRYNCTVSV